MTVYSSLPALIRAHESSLIPADDSSVDLLSLAVENVIDNV